MRRFPCTRIKIDLFTVPSTSETDVVCSAPEFWMEKVRRAAPQALVAWGAALRALYAKILRQNELPKGSRDFPWESYVFLRHRA